MHRWGHQITANININVHNIYKYHGQFWEVLWRRSKSHNYTNYNYYILISDKLHYLGVLVTYFIKVAEYILKSDCDTNEEKCHTIQWEKIVHLPISIWTAYCVFYKFLSFVSSKFLSPGTMVAHIIFYFGSNYLLQFPPLFCKVIWFIFNVVSVEEFQSLYK